MLRIPSVLGAVCALSLSVAAQPSLTDNIIGFASGGSPSTTPPTIQNQTLCGNPNRVCPTGVGPASAFAGGAAYNAMNQSVWHTQGSRMAESTIDGCRLICSVAAANSLGAGAVASGLALSESRLSLYQLETRPGAAALHTFHLRSCPPQVVSSCRFRLPTNAHAAGAVAIDQKDGVVFYAASVFNAANPANVVLVAKLTDPCNILCRFQVGSCASNRIGAITGMAFDECSGRLYVTDGKTTATMKRATASDPCSYEVAACCTTGPAGGQTWHGIDIESLHPQTVGRSCIGRNCRPCRNLALVTHGDPAIGNPRFAFSIENGETGARGFLAFNIGRCRAQTIPGFCGPYYPALAPPSVVLPMGTLMGSGSCDGRTTMSVPVPVDYSLCGGAMCFQGLVLCPSTGGPGLSLTNAIQIVVS